LHFLVSPTCWKEKERESQQSQGLVRFLKDQNKEGDARGGDRMRGRGSRKGPEMTLNLKKHSFISGHVKQKEAITGSRSGGGWSWSMKK